MALNTRFLIEDDYALLCEWWKEWEWTPPPKDFLPQDGRGGILVLNDEDPVCAGFVYFTNSKVAWIEFIISDRKYRGENRVDAIQVLLQVLELEAKAGGAEYIYTTTKNSALEKTYVEHGYTIGALGTNEYIKKIKCQQ